MVSDVAPLLVSTEVICALVVFSRWFPNGIVDGAKFTVEVTPVPLRFTTCEVGLASSVNVTVAANGVRAVGVKVTFTMQLLHAGTVDALVQVVPAAMANADGLAPPSATVARFNVPFPPLVSVIVRGALIVPFV